MLFILGLIIGLLNAIIIILLYSRKEQIITRYLDRALVNKEKAKFYEPISSEEQINEIFNIKNKE